MFVIAQNETQGSFFIIPITITGSLPLLYYVIAKWSYSLFNTIKSLVFYNVDSVSYTHLDVYKRQVYELLFQIN